MGVINVLPLSVINKIAAGEVIERPASVIKELVENSLDAQASLISIEVEDGGRKLLRVTDDGFGMAPDDVALAFASHATSKLKTGDDLFFITTMGFRGEALSSIGAVSHARIVSRLRGAAEGAEVELDGGSPAPARAKGAPEGTAVEVADLFFNVPARRKFLRSATTEFAHILDLISRVALANPGIAFRLVHNGREVLNLRPADDRRRRLGDLYGREMAEAMLAVDSGSGPVRVTGFAAPPVHCRASRKMQLTYVNGRFIRDRGLSHAIASAYEGMLIRGRFPVSFLFLHVDPREVDVNVHPTKIEVRFHQGQIIYKTVLGAIREALRGADLTPVFEPTRYEPQAAPMPWPEQQRPLPSKPASPPPFERPPLREPEQVARTAAAPVEPATPERPGRVCFQIADAYIVEERETGIAIFDQHALHECVIFNEIQRRLGRARLESQRRLIPAVVNLSRSEVALLVAERESLAAVGIDLSEFGPDSVGVHALPAVLGSAAPESVVHGILAELTGDVRESPVEAKKLAMAKLIACHAAIKAGERLTQSEMRSLLDRAGAIAERDTCPHGRPVCIFLPFADLERQFKRQ